MTTALNEIDKLKNATTFECLAEHSQKIDKGVLTLTFNDSSKIYIEKDKAFTLGEIKGWDRELYKITIKNNIQYNF